MTELVRANGIVMRHALEGAGKPVVLIHGVGNQLEAWDGVVALLHDRFRLLRYDLRGHGESEKVPGPYAIEDFSDDLLALLDALKVERCDVAGFSLGGLVAQSFALRHPKRVRKLALLSTVAGRTEAEKERVLERLAIVADGIPGDHFSGSIERWFTDEFRGANQALIADYAARNRQNDP